MDGCNALLLEFFLTNSLTRLIGNASVFLRTEDIMSLQNVAIINTLPKPFGTGSFRIQCGPRLSANDRQVDIIKDSTRVHDDLWRLFFRICGNYVSKHPNGSSSVLETRIYNCLVRSSSILGADWPSSLRNTVNYRPGFAYDTIRRGGKLESLRYMIEIESSDVSAVIDRFEQNLSILRTPEDIIYQTRVVCRLLTDLTLLMYSITNELFIELIDRNGLDKRWNENRMRFLEQEGLKNNGRFWPY